MKLKRPVWLGIALFIGFFLQCNISYALEPSETTTDLLQYFRDNMAAWEPALRGTAERLFWLLAGIEFTWSAIRLALKGMDFNEILAELFKTVLRLGFFWFLLLHSTDLANALIQSFKMAAINASSTPPPDIAQIFSIGLNIGSKLLNWNFATSIANLIVACLSALAIIICMGLMAANMIEAIIESYFVISAGVILMGFGGSSWTSEYAKKLLVYAFSVGVKLFVLQLVIGLAQTVLLDLASRFDPSSIQDTLVMVGAALILWLLSLNIPNKLQALINGTSFGQGGMIAGAITAGMAAAASIGAAAATGGTSTLAGATSTVLGASKLASQQMQNSGTPPTLANRLRQMANNTKEAGMGTLGQRFRGEVHRGNFGGQMGHAMSQQAEALKTQREAQKEASKEKNTIYPQQ